MTTNPRSGPPGTVNLTDIRFSVSQTRTNYTRLRDNPTTQWGNEPRPDLITLICLISQIYRIYGEELAPIRQFHPGREVVWNSGHTSSVSHTRIGRHGMPETLEKELETSELNRFEVIIVKRPRESLSRTHSRALISFITELRIRTHPPLREHPNIAQLRGVGWDFEDAEYKFSLPLLLEELAPQGDLENFWKHWSFVRLNFQQKLDLCRNIAEGLTALHGCGVVHGDVKPANVLIFPTRAADNAFIAKLTDFGHSVCESDRLEYLPAFTLHWCAPELLYPPGFEKMSFQGMKETDYYSYGLVILSIMISRPYHECQKHNTEELEEARKKDTMLDKCNEILEQSDKENPDSDLDLSVTSALLRRTVRLIPKRRSLKHALQVMLRFDEYNEQRAKDSKTRTATGNSMIPVLNTAKMVAVGHVTLSSTSYQLKSHIVERLQSIASSREPRHLAAAWELSICYFSGFGADVNFEKCSHWLVVASQGGIVAAQHYFDVIHQAMAMRCPDTEWKRAQNLSIINGKRTRIEIAPTGYRALECDEYDSKSDPDSSEDQQSQNIPMKVTMPEELFDIVSQGTYEQLESYMHANPQFRNSQDATGATPLILAAKLQHADMVRYLAAEPMVDASITTHEGHTVLHFLSSYDNELITELVPLLAEKHVDIHHEALSGPLATEGTVFSSGIRCCSLLNAIIHGNTFLLQALLKVAHRDEGASPCKICEAGSSFRRILAVALSIFQVEAAYCLVRHTKDNRRAHDIDFDNIRVWAGQELLPLYKVPFKSVAIGALDLPESFFRAINYGSKFSTVLQQTIEFLLSIGGNDQSSESMLYSMLTSAVKSNNVDAARILLRRAQRQGFRRRWWLQGPLDDSPFMLSIIHGFREIYSLFLQEEPSILKEYANLTCWEPSCEHKPTKKVMYLAAFLGRTTSEIMGEDRKHKLNLVQRAILEFIMAHHQDKFFLDSFLDPSNSHLITKEENTLMRVHDTIEKWPVGFSLPKYPQNFAEESEDRILRRVDGANFMEQAILYSFFSHATSITNRHHEIWLTKIRWSKICFWRSESKNKLLRTSRPMVKFVLRFGSDDQCEFMMKHLLTLRTRTGWGETATVSQNARLWHTEDGVALWTQCPLLTDEFDSLLQGNIRGGRPDRHKLWDAIEEQVNMGHSTSVAYLKQAIFHGNPDAVAELLQRGWSANGPMWARFMTPLQYSKGFTQPSDNFRYMFYSLNHGLPQIEWIGSATHAVTYKAYIEQRKDRCCDEWRRRLLACQQILEKEGGKIYPIATWFQTRADSVQLWLLVFGSMLYALILPWALVYGTTGTWTAMTTKRKVGFAYLWTSLCYCVPPILPFLDKWVERGLVRWPWRLPPLVLIFVVNHFVLPLLVVQHNWQPLLSCRLKMGDTTIDAKQVSLTCTDYSYLLPLVVGGAECALWILWLLTRRKSGVVSDVLLGH